MKNHFKRASLRRRSGSSITAASPASVDGSHREDRGCATPCTPPGGEPAWSKLFSQFQEEPGQTAPLQGATGKLSVEGFSKAWTAALRNDGITRAPENAELAKAFRIVFNPDSRGYVSREDFEIGAPRLWEFRFDLGQLLSKLAAVDAEAIDQLFTPQAKPVPRHMLAMLFQQFLKGGGGSSQFSKLYAAVAKQYQVSGAPAEDVMEAYDTIVLADVTEAHLQESIFTTRFNIIWQRQGEVAMLSSAIAATLASEPTEEACTKRSIMRASKFESAGPGLINRRRGRASVADNDKCGLGIPPGQNPMAVPRASLKGSRPSSPTEISTISISTPSEDRLNRLYDVEKESSQLQMFPEDSDADSQPRLRGGGKKARSPWDGSSDEGAPKQKAKGAAKARGPWDGSSDEGAQKPNAKGKTKPRGPWNGSSDEGTQKPEAKGKTKAGGRGNSEEKDTDKRDQSQFALTAKAKAKRKAASSQGKAASSPRGGEGGRGAKTRDPWGSDESEEEGKQKKKAVATDRRAQASETGTEEAASETSSTVGGTTPRSRKTRSSYAEERKVARARAKAGQRSQAPQADASEISRPVQADELPEDDGSQWAPVRGEVRFMQWPGTSQWAESLDDNAGRAVGASLAQMVADRALDTEGASERRLRALLDGPHRRPVGSTSPMPTAILSSSAHEAITFPSAQMMPRSPRNVSPVSSTLAQSANQTSTVARDPDISPTVAQSTPRAASGPLTPLTPPNPAAWGGPLAVAASATPSRSPGTASRSPAPKLRERSDLPSLPSHLLLPPSLSPRQALTTSRRAEELHQDPEVFREMLCISDEPSAYWIADEMMATMLPSNMHPLDPQSRDPLVLQALSRCAPEVPPILYMSLASGTPEILLRHPFQDVFDQTVALASLMEKSTSPQVLVDAAEEAWKSQYNKAVTGWREERAVGGVAEYINAETGERSATDPRQRLLRELQLGCRLMAMLRARDVAPY